MISPRPFLDVLQGNLHHPNPIWLMRQAGRYLPIYQKFAQMIPNFWERCYTPDISSEITTFPIQSFALDALIFFSDILVIPKALGQNIWFDQGVHVEDCNVQKKLEMFDVDLFHQHLFPVYQGITWTLLKIETSIPIIGFAGAPWTLLSYMIGGSGPNRFERTRAFAVTHSDTFTWMIERLASIVAQHLLNQISAGVDAIQIFDSWAAEVPLEQREVWLLEPWQYILDQVKRDAPHIPILLFPRGYPGELSELNQLQHLEGISLSEHMNVPHAAEILDSRFVLQGGLHPELLKTGGPFLRQAIEQSLTVMKSRPYIVNLGHGVLPDTPTEHVQQLIDVVHNFPY